MSNRPAPISQTDVKRLLKGAEAAGFKIGKVEFDGGKVVLFRLGVTAQTDLSPLEKWKAENGER